MLTAREAPKACLSCRSQLLALFEHGFTRSTVPIIQSKLRRDGNGQRSYLTSTNPHNRSSTRTFSTNRISLDKKGPEDAAATLKQENLSDGSLEVQGKETSEEVTNFEREVSGDLSDEVGLERLADEQETKNYEFGLEFAEELVEAEKILRTEKGTETVVRSAREKFGQYLPEGILTIRESAMYERLYGKPAKEVAPDQEEEAEEFEKSTLLRENEQGELEEVDYNPEVDFVDHDPKGGYTGEVDIPNEYEKPMRRKSKRQKELDAKWQLEQDINASLARTDIPSELDEVVEEEEDELDEEEDGDALSSDHSRTHPRTIEGRFGTFPSTIHLPKQTFVLPIAELLTRTSTRHLVEASHRAFGGPNIPHSASTPMARGKLSPQKHIGLEAGQFRMSEIEADAYIACVLPATYATVSAVLVETRKRLGRSWLQNLLTLPNGPQVLDAGAGGAGLLAWRDIIQAEWDALKSDGVVGENQEISTGRQTVLAGSRALRHRMSSILQDTTFLPRLPDYIHATNPERTLDGAGGALGSRKKYDIIIAPHTLLPLNEEFKRKKYIQNLWSLLNPRGGVLIFQEKGHPRGFEVIAGARALLLKDYISSPHDPIIENQIQDHDIKGRYSEKEKGMIVAPCTNHVKCPMYRIEGVTEGRKDFCHFEQRFIRPSWLQKVVGAGSRNHEDVKYSYLVVRRGADYRQDNPELFSDLLDQGQQTVIQGEEATQAALAGYETPFTIPEEEASNSTKTLDIENEFVSVGGAMSFMPQAPESKVESNDTEDVNDVETDKPPFTPFNVPRTILPPLKRHQHVTLDLCTPSGTLERWTIPKSFSKQAYRDARKSQWGDLWALGAKVRVAREPRLGRKGNGLGNGGKNGEGDNWKGNLMGKRARGRKKGGVNRFEIDVGEKGLEGIREVSGGMVRAREGKRGKGGRKDKGGGAIGDDDI